MYHVEEVDDSPEIIINSMAGVIGVNSIRLIGKIQGKEVTFLVDIGATHNFVDPMTVDKIGLKPT